MDQLRNIKNKNILLSLWKQASLFCGSITTMIKTIKTNKFVTNLTKAPVFTLEKAIIRIFRPGRFFVTYFQVCFLAFF